MFNLCSIIGYIGSGDGAPLLVKALRRMEYRGYDSAGVAMFSDGEIVLRKGVGKVEQVNSAQQLELLPGKVGIGHTRWATHGGVNADERAPAPLLVGEDSHRPQRDHRELRGAQGRGGAARLPLQERDRQRGHREPACSATATSG